MQNDSDPLQFLFEHLEGRQSWLRRVSLYSDTHGDSNIYVAYRTVVVKVMALFLDAQEAEFKMALGRDVKAAEFRPYQDRLRQSLAVMRDTDRRLHLRIAA